MERMWRKGKPPTLLVEMKVGAATMENNVEVPQKAKGRTNIRSSSLTHGHTPGQIYNSKRYMWRPTPRPWVQGLVPRIQMWSPTPRSSLELSPIATSHELFAMSPLELNQPAP